jgi:uncharacterized membrane protein
VGWIHTLCAVAALVLGARVIAARKGTVTHAWVGRFYLLSMLAVNVTSLAIFHLTGTFNIVHILALVSLATISVGYLQVLNRRRWRNWLWRHYQYMLWSYVGLLAATVNEGFVRIPVLQRLTAGTTPALPMFAMAGLLVVAGVLIKSRQKGVLAHYGNPVRTQPPGSAG